VDSWSTNWNYNYFKITWNYMMQIIGMILPPFIDLINRKIADSAIRFLVSVAVCAVFGVAVAAIDSQGFHYESWGEGVKAITLSITSVIGFAQLVYQGAYKDSNLQEKIRG
jgi:hypothetical protein